MTTFQIAISIIGAVISLLTLLGLGVVMKNFWDDKHKEALAARDDEKAKAKKERQDEIREVIQEEIKPLEEGIAELKQDVKTLKGSMVTIDRIVMKITLDSYRQQGYASASDRAAWKEVYDDYKALGGNHFKEYVDEWLKALEALPKKEDIMVAISDIKDVKGKATGKK